MKAGRRGPRAHFACRPWLVALLLSSGVGAAPDEARRFWRARGGPWAPCGSSCGLRVAGGGEMWLPIQRAALPKPPSRGWDAGRRVAGVSRSPSEVLSPRGMRGDGCLCLLVSYNASCAFCVVVSLVFLLCWRAPVASLVLEDTYASVPTDRFGFAARLHERNQLNLAAASRVAQQPQRAKHWPLQPALSELAQPQQKNAKKRHP